uniref:Uncharacterized protein n=1 Tax=Arundo donax TaxID=35708 RepID=A0A0A9E4W1_ARUDO
MFNIIIMYDERKYKLVTCELPLIGILHHPFEYCFKFFWIIIYYVIYLVAIFTK